MVSATLCGVLVAGLGCGQAAMTEAGVAFEHVEGTCSECRLTVEHVVTLGTMDGPGAFSAEPGPFARDATGRYYAVVSDRSRELPYVFDADGTFLRRIGSLGEGPGEYLNPRLVEIDQRGNLIIWDQRIGRLSVLDSSDAIVEEGHFIYQLWDMEALPDGDLIVSGRIRTPDQIGYAIHRFSTDGEWVISWDEYVEAPTVAKYSRFMSMGPSGLWAVTDVHEYTISLWDEHGQLLREFNRQPPWYTPYEDFTTITIERPPQPIIRGIWEQDGAVLAVAMREDAQWPEGLGDPSTNELGEEEYSVIDLHAVFDGQIEAIDAVTGELLAALRMDRFPAWVVDPGAIAVIREDEVGWWYADVYSVTLVRENP